MRERAELIGAIVAGGPAADAAADELLAGAECCTGAPPGELLDALTAPDEFPRGHLHRIALAWDRAPLSAALLDVVRASPDTDRRETAAWLLKDTLDASDAAAAVALATSEHEPPAVRRWLAEGLARLAAGGSIGWPELGELVQVLASDPEPPVRGGAVGVLMVLPRTERGAQLLLGMLDDPDAEVLAGAVRALQGDAEAAATVDRARLRGLLEHPHPLVRSGAAKLAALRSGQGR